jgi:uncharacterized protein (TIGR02996 family)
MQSNHSDNIKIVIVNGPISVEEREHINAIAVKPEDDELRLIYARWLAVKTKASAEEIDRSRFIEVQCRLGQMLQSADGLSEKETREQLQLVKEERRLLQQHGEDWSAYIKTEMPCVHEVVFRRGLPEILIVDSAQFPADAARLPEVGPTVRAITLCAPREFRVGGELTQQILALPALQRLHRLSFKGHWGDGIAWLLAESPVVAQLSALDLSYCGLSPAAVRAIIASPRLASMNELALCGNDIGFDGAMEISLLPRLAPCLRKLHLEDTGINDAAATLLAHAPALLSLDELRLEGNPLDVEGITELLNSTMLRNTIIGADTAQFPLAVGQEIDRRLARHARALGGRHR